MRVMGASQFSRVCVLGSVTLLALVSAACSRRANEKPAPAPRTPDGLPVVDGPSDALRSPEEDGARKPTDDAAKVVEDKVEPTQQQKADLSSGLETDLKLAFQETLKQSSQLAASDSKAVLVEALSAAAAHASASKISGNIASSCTLPSSEKMEAYSSCLLEEVALVELASIEKTKLALEKQPHKATFVSALDKLGNNGLAALWNEILSTQTLRQGLTLSIADVLKELRGIVDLLLLKQARLDIPFLAKSFFENKSFVYTNSFQQGSTGSQRVFNLDSYLVKLKVNMGRLVILQDKQGLYNGSSGEDLVLGSFPIVSARTGSDGDVYYQVDFSQPENKRFLLPVLVGPGSAVDLKADVVVPTVAHAAKPTMSTLGSGLYFGKNDKSLVLDSLVLVSSPKDIFGEDEEKDGEEEETEDQKLGKDNLRPTLRVAQGLFLVDEASEEFAKNQQIDVKVAQEKLSLLGVRDLAAPKDVPYFTGANFLYDNYGRGYEQRTNVRKFNLKKDLVFVVSASTPAKAIPAVKAAVLAYARTFEKLSPTPVKISVLTQGEFEKANRDGGLALGGSVNAADPRVNMINWDDNLDLGAAWATAVANPRTGEVISADVMMSGAMWAQVGCLSFMERSWKRDADRAGDSATVPSNLTRKLWGRACDITLENLGIFKPKPADTAGGDNAIVPNEVARASARGDASALAALASRAFGTTVQPADMTVDLSQKSSSSKALSSSEKSALNKEAMKSVRNVFSDVKKAQSSHNAAHYKLGGNSIQFSLDCVRHLPMPGAEANIFESDAGSPGFTSEFLKSPEAAALALVKMVVVHELGHAFGLRHNFIASTTPAQFEEGTTPSLPIYNRTDSVMDYNDYGVELDLGVLRDFDDAESAAGLPEFGVYDVLALANAYGLDASSIKLKKQAVFCTDRNISPIGNCQQFDYGKSFAEYNLHQLNLRLLRLRHEALSLESIPVMTRAAKTLTSLMLQWQLAQDLANEPDATPLMKLVFLNEANLAYQAKGVQQEFLTKFSEKFGAPLLAVSDLMNMRSDYFAEPSTADLGATLFHRFSATVFASTVGKLHDALKEGDAKHLPMIHDHELMGTKFAFQSDALKTFATEIVIPKGGSMACTHVDEDGNAHIGLAKVEKDFFNYVGNAFEGECVTSEKDSQGAAVSFKTVVTGFHEIEDLKLMALASSLVAAGHESSASVLRLRKDAKILKSCKDTGATCPNGGEKTRIAAEKVELAMSELATSIANADKYQPIIEKIAGK